MFTIKHLFLTGNNVIGKAPEIRQECSGGSPPRTGSVGYGKGRHQRNSGHRHARNDKIHIWEPAGRTLTSGTSLGPGDVPIRLINSIRKVHTSVIFQQGKVLKKQNMGTGYTKDNLNSYRSVNAASVWYKH